MASQVCRLAVMLVGFAIVTGCSKSTEPVVPGSPRLTTAVEVRQSTIAPGGTVDLTLSVTNHEPEQVTIWFTSTCQMLYAVQNSFGAQVSEYSACGAFGGTMTLLPGETQEVASAWRASRYVYDVGAEVPLPPGTYRVYAYLSEHGYVSEPAEVQVRE